MPARTTIAPVHWSAIIGQLAEKKCVPFLGAAANISAEGYAGLPLGKDLAASFLGKLTGRQSFDAGLLDSHRLATELLAMLDRAAPDERMVELRERLAHLVAAHESFSEYRDLTQLRMLDLARVALHVRIASDVPTFAHWLRELLPDEDRAPSRLLRTLADLPLRLVITTNYDRLMERALGPRAHQVVTQPIGGFRDGPEWTRLEDDLAATDDVIVYKLHGSFDDPVRPGPADELIITEEDYIELLTVLGREIGGIPTRIKGLIKEGTLLFLGYGLEDWDFRTIFKGLVESLQSGERRRAFAIQKDPPQFWVDFWEKKDVTIYNVDLYEFADELADRYQRHGAA
jgi:hypothetical protein